MSPSVAEVERELAPRVAAVEAEAFPSFAEVWAEVYGPAPESQPSPFHDRKRGTR